MTLYIVVEKSTGKILFISGTMTGAVYYQISRLEPDNYEIQTKQAV